MAHGFHIVSVDERNITEYPHIICFINPKHESFHIKIDWLKKRYSEGLRIKLLYPEGEKRPAGFIEYTAGENAWRAVSAENYLFIHCLWVSPTRYKKKGYATFLINDCIGEAKTSGRSGVAVMTSEGSFMAGRDVFQKGGFKIVDEAEPQFGLWVKTLNDTPAPRFNDWETELSRCKGLHIVYSLQCPWVGRFVEDIRNKQEYCHLNIVFTKLKTPEEAQKAPSPYATFSFIHNGKLLADHYISENRFKNILENEKLL